MEGIFDREADKYHNSGGSIREEATITTTTTKSNVYPKIMRKDVFNQVKVRKIFSEMGVSFSNKNLELLQSYSKILKNHSEISISHTLYEAMKRDEELEPTKPKASISVLSTERSARRTKEKKRKDSDKSKYKPHSISPS